MHISERIRYIIDELNLNVNSFSKEIGLSNNVTVGKIINEKRNPSYEVMMKILSTYPQISTTWLVKGTGAIYNYDPSESSDVVSENESQYKLRAYQRKIDSIEKKLLEVMMEFKDLKDRL